MNSPVIAGIGARGTPPKARKQITELGALCRRLGIWVRSGHAPGADYAWEKGARERTVVYLPFPGFNDGAPLLTPRVVCLGQASSGAGDYRRPHEQATERASQAIRDYHPSQGKLMGKPRLFQLRNYFQVMGAGPGDAPVGAVVYWAPEDEAGNVEGGTGQAVRVARAAELPAWNLARVDAGEVARRLEALVSPPRPA